MKNGKSDEYALVIDNKAIAVILDKQLDVVPPTNPLALDYESMQVYYVLEALRLYMEDQMLTPNFKVELNE